MTTATAPRPVGELLREWRDRRRISQLDLAISADISTRHLSFVETGRSAPSRDMVLRLGEHLDVPLRERNQLLLAAGFAPVYGESGLDAPEMAAAREAVRQLLTVHEPYPAVVVDRRWNMVDSNASVALLIAGVAPELLDGPVNVLRATLHPDGMAPRIANLGEWRAHLLGRLRREVAATADPELSDLLAELRGYPCADVVPEVEVPKPGDIVVPLRLRHGDTELSFFSTVATFGTPLDVTLAELSIEAFFPADAHTAEVIRSTPLGPPAG
ncbi:helix-turn-helix domain-containing protein [Amycolatopsis sp. 195334CR]|uniref:helix-turn-helix domain-containing protein n=1 Tax=Amycolatopsis sp. 195334CR TaxID=2814588 RepID=UPI001A909145|nr:helix-turn-helix transcriptional regulator [Amycolatopsis sp. 195334CR]MBN6039337.1 helix-turn-helix transcriptional regulator [Amycolatopsis sp. 195334CR]